MPPLNLQVACMSVSKQWTDFDAAIHSMFPACASIDRILVHSAYAELSVEVISYDMRSQRIISRNKTEGMHLQCREESSGHRGVTSVSQRPIRLLKGVIHLPSSLPQASSELPPP